jgi:GxxExxY protein
VSEEEFRIRGIDCLPQYRLPLVYKGRTLSDEFILDFYFPGQLVVELKAVERIIPVFEAQLLSYLRLTLARVGLLLNFNSAVMRDGIKRMVL